MEDLTQVRLEREILLLIVFSMIGCSIFFFLVGCIVNCLNEV